MIIEYPESGNIFAEYETPEARLKDRFALDDRIDRYQAKLYHDKHELENTKGFFARLRLKKQIRDTEDILQHLNDVVNHWYDTFDCFSDHGKSMDRKMIP